MENTEYKDRVLRIYDAVTDPTLWPEVIDQIAERTGAHGGLVYEMRTANGERWLEPMIMSSSYRPHIVEDHFRTFQKYELRDHDAFDRALLPLDAIDILSEDILYADADVDYSERPHVVALGKLGIRHRTGALLDKDNPHRARFSLAMTEDRGPFSEADRQLLRELLPHVAKALELSRPTGLGLFGKRVLAEILDQLAVGVCILDSNSNVILKNEEFDRQHEAYGAFRIELNGRLSLNERGDRKKFSQLVSNVLSHGHFGARPRKEAVVVDNEDGSGALCIEVTPLDRWQEHGSKPLKGALIISRDTAKPISVDVDLAKSVFNLTAAEAAVVEQVCDGLTNSQIADQRSRSVETINSQLKTVLNKTRALNRTQLVRLLCNFSLHKRR